MMGSGPSGATGTLLPSTCASPATGVTTVERFQAALDRAVARAVDGGRAGIFLSGGLDLVSVAAVAADQAERSGHERPVALSLGFPDPACNEENITARDSAEPGSRSGIPDICGGDERSTRVGGSARACGAMAGSDGKYVECRV